jgi:hypothetical protein
MGFYDSRLNFMLENHSQAEVSLMTGIPQSTISYVSRGLRDLPDIYKNDVKNAYQRDAYKQLLNAIPNTVNANRFRGYAPDTVRGVIKEMNALVEEYSYGAVASIFQNLQRDPTKQEIQTALPASIEAVKAGLAASYYSLEIWRDYKNLKL